MESSKKQLCVEYIPVTDIRPYDRNAKKHPKEQIEETANSIKRFGWKQPLVIDKDGTVVVGHCRLLAAKKLGLKSVPCIRADDLTEEEIKAYRLVDNKTNESEWDLDLLDMELKELDALDFDMQDFGFDLSDGGVETVEVSEDNYDTEPPKEPRARVGDLYRLGDHYLICGDCTDENVINRLLDGIKADLLLTDPPYGISVVSRGGTIGTGNWKRRRRRTAPLQEESEVGA